MNLSELKIGEVGTIVSVEKSPFSDKLQEMGCVKGTKISPVRKAPLGDPIAFELEDYTLSMRRKEAETILITKTTS